MPDLENSLALCTYCPRLCSHMCPVSITTGRETLTPQAKMSRFARLHRGPLSGPVGTVPRHDEAEDQPGSSLPLYGCTGCGACTTACLHGVEPATALMQGRVAVEAAGLGHPTLAELPERHRRRALAAAGAVTADPELAGRVAGAGEVAFLPTCLPRGSEERGPADEARVALRVCDRVRTASPTLPAVGVAALAGTDAAPGPGGCAGYPLYAGGFDESFRLHAESFARAIEKYSTLVVSCSACTWLLRTQYQQHGVPVKPQILHTSELLAPHAAALPVKNPVPTASYHDPCHLGRRLGCYEPPRQLLRRAVAELHELPEHRTHEESRCCGSGGLLPITDPGAAQAMAEERLGDADAQHGPLVSSCPACQHHLAKSGGEAGPPVRELLDILDEATR